LGVRRGVKGLVCNGKPTLGFGAPFIMPEAVR
jgi:hypothetical protein